MSLLPLLACLAAAQSLLGDLEALAGRASPSGLEAAALGARFAPVPGLPPVAAPQERGLLASKAALMDARARKEHQPWQGLIATHQLDDNGAFTSYKSLSDQAIWTGTFVAAQAFRLGATGDPDALAAMEKSLWGLHALHEASGIPGLIAAGLLPKDYVEKQGLTGKSNYIRGKGKYADWYWVSNTSHDQYAGYLFGIAAAWPHIKDAALKQALTEDLRAIGRHAIRNDLRIIGPHEAIDFRANWYYQERWPSLIPKGIPLPPFRGGSAGHGLHIMKVVAALTGDREFQDFYEEEMIVRRELDLDLERYGPQYAPQLLKRYKSLIEPVAKAFYGSDVELRPEALRASLSMNLSHMALFDLCRLETEPELKARYCKVLRKTHDAAAGEGNTFWNFLHASQTPDPREVADGLESLRRFPAEARFGGRKNSEDPSIAKYKGVPEKIHKKGDSWQWYAEKPLPFERRSAHAAFAWQSNPYQLDSDDRRDRGSGTDYLVAYWMGRYYGFIGAND